MTSLNDSYEKTYEMSSPDTLIVNLNGGSAIHAPPLLSSCWALSTVPSEKPTHQILMKPYCLMICACMCGPIYVRQLLCAS